MGQSGIRGAGAGKQASPALPIGGVKDSGSGRFGRWSAENFTDRHVVTVNAGHSRQRI